MPAGRPPKPAKLRELNGNAGKRKINKSVNPAPAGVPKMVYPKWLESKAEKEMYAKNWKEFGAILDGMKLLTKMDVAAFKMLVTVYTKWMLAENDYRFQVADSKDAKRYADIAMKQQTNALRILSEFGLTPSSRMKIQLPADKKDDFDAFLDGEDEVSKARKNKKYG